HGVHAGDFPAGLAGDLLHHVFGDGYLSFAGVELLTGPGDGCAAGGRGLGGISCSGLAHQACSFRCGRSRYRGGVAGRFTWLDTADRESSQPYRRKFSSGHTRARPGYWSSVRVPGPHSGGLTVKAAPQAVEPAVGDAYLVARAREGYLDAYELLVERHS